MDQEAIENRINLLDRKVESFIEVVVEKLMEQERLLKKQNAIIKKLEKALEQKRSP